MGGVGAQACPEVGVNTSVGRVGVEVAVPPGAYNQSQLAAAVGEAVQVGCTRFSDV